MRPRLTAVTLRFRGMAAARLLWTVAVLIVSSSCGPSPTSTHAIDVGLAPLQIRDGERAEVRITAISGAALDSEGGTIEVPELRFLEGRWRELPAGTNLVALTRCGSELLRVQPFSGVIEPSGRFWLELEGPNVSHPESVQCDVAVVAVDSSVVAAPVTLASMRTRAFKITPVVQVIVRPREPLHLAPIQITAIAGETVSTDTVVTVGNSFSVAGSFVAPGLAGLPLCLVVAQRDATWLVLDCAQPWDDYWSFPLVHLPGPSRGPALVSLIAVALRTPSVGTTLTWHDLTNQSRARSASLTLHVTAPEISIVTLRDRRGKIFTIDEGAPLPMLDDVIETDVGVVGELLQDESVTLLLQPTNGVPFHVALGPATRVSGDRWIFSTGQLRLAGASGEQVAMRAMVTGEPLSGRTLADGDLSRVAIALSSPVVVPMRVQLRPGMSPTVAIESLNQVNIETARTITAEGDFVEVMGRVAQAVPGDRVCAGIGAGLRRWRFSCAASTSDGDWRMTLDTRPFRTGTDSSSVQIVAVVGNRIIESVPETDRDWWQAFSAAESAPVMLAISPGALQQVWNRTIQAGRVVQMIPVTWLLAMIVLGVSAYAVQHKRDNLGGFLPKLRAPRFHDDGRIETAIAMERYVRQRAQRRSHDATRRLKTKIAAVEARLDVGRTKLAELKILLDKLLAGHMVVAFEISHLWMTTGFPILFVADLVLNSQAFLLFDAPYALTVVFAFAVTMGMAIAAHLLGTWARHLRPPILGGVLKIVGLSASVLAGLWAANDMRMAYLMETHPDNLHEGAFIVLNAFVVAAAALLVYGSRHATLGVAETSRRIRRLEQKLNRNAQKLRTLQAKRDARREGERLRAEELIALWSTRSGFVGAGPNGSSECATEQRLDPNSVIVTASGNQRVAEVPISTISLPDRGGTEPNNNGHRKDAMPL